MDSQNVVWGWHEDPYRIHQERWVSGDGTLTMLVKDNGQESYDPPPEPSGPGTA